MAQTGYIPIQLYYSSTAGHTPVAANLNNGELAINIADGKLFYKDSGGTVQTIANSAWSGTVTSVGLTVPSFLSVSGSPVTTSGTLALSLSGTALPVSSGGTGLTSVTAGYITFGSSSTALSSSANLFWDSANNRMYIGATSLGLTTAATVPLSVTGQMFIGASNSTLNTNKDFRFGSGAYTNNAATVILFSANSTNNNILYGGGTGAGEPATYHAWYTGTVGTLGAGTEKMRLHNSGGLSLGNTTDPGANNLSVTGTIASASTIKTAGYTVATLPTAGTAGRRAYVTDATAPTWLGALTGGGTVKCPVFDNGTAWVAG